MIVRTGEKELDAATFYDEGLEAAALGVGVGRGAIEHVRVL